MFRRRSHLNRKKKEKDQPFIPHDDIHRDQLEFHRQQQLNGFDPCDSDDDQEEDEPTPPVAAAAIVDTASAELEPASEPTVAALAPGSKEPVLSYYAYGKSSAIEFVCEEIRKNRVSTITLQAASAKESDDRGYEWENKTAIPLPRNELLQMTAILLGKLNHAEFRHANQFGSKSYSFEHQANKVLVMVAERGKPIRAVGLSAEDSYQIAALCLRQLKANSPWLNAAEIISLIDLTVASMRKPDSRSGVENARLQVLPVADAVRQAAPQSVKAAAEESALDIHDREFLDAGLLD